MPNNGAGLGIWQHFMIYKRNVDFLPNGLLFSAWQVGGWVVAVGCWLLLGGIWCGLVVVRVRGHATARIFACQMKDINSDNKQPNGQNRRHIKIHF